MVYVFVTPVDNGRIPLTKSAGIVGISDQMQKKIKVAIAGVGNCASALVQGVEYYRSRRNAALDGVMHQVIGGYRASDVEFVSAFDVDKRKVGRPLEEAIFAKPNNTRVFQSSLPISYAVFCLKKKTRPT